MSFIVEIAGFRLLGLFHFGRYSRNFKGIYIPLVKYFQGNNLLLNELLLFRNNLENRPINNRTDTYLFRLENCPTPYIFLSYEDHARCLILYFAMA